MKTTGTYQLIIDGLYGNTAIGTFDTDTGQEKAHNITLNNVQRQKREKALYELAQQAQELDMGY